MEKAGSFLKGLTESPDFGTRNRVSSYQRKKNAGTKHDGRERNVMVMAFKIGFAPENLENKPMEDVIIESIEIYTYGE